jgi:hypothetical protein
VLKVIRDIIIYSSEENTKYNIRVTEVLRRMTAEDREAADYSITDLSDLECTSTTVPSSILTILLFTGC